METVLAGRDNHHGGSDHGIEDAVGITELAYGVLIAALACLLMDALIHFYFAIKALRLIEQAPPIQLDPVDQLPAHERFETPCSSRQTVKGLLFPPTDGTAQGVIVFCPEAFGDARSAMNYVPALLDHSWAVVAIDFRKEAASPVLPQDRPPHWCTRDEIIDSQAVLNFVFSCPQFQDLPVVLFGVCRGASAALIVGAKEPRVTGIICQGAFSVSGLQGYFARRWLEREFGERAKYIPQWHARLTMWLTRKISEWTRNCRYMHVEPYLVRWQGRPALFISAASDSYVPPEVSRQLCEQMQLDPERHQWIVPKAKHNRERRAAPDQYDARIVEFGRSCLKSAVTPTVDGDRLRRPVPSA